MKNQSNKPIFQQCLPLHHHTLFSSPSAYKRFVAEYEALARTRLSKNFILRDLLFSIEAASLGLSNYTEHPELVIAAGRALCEKILEPVLANFGQFSITFGYQCRQAIEYGMPESERSNPHSSNPHHYDRKTWGGDVYSRIDIWPFCVEDGEVSRRDFGQWLMMNCDVDLLMQWSRSNVYCITISPKPRRVWIEWGNPKNGEPKQKIFM